MNYRIEKKDAFRIVGISAPLNREIENNFMIVPKMWEDAAVSGTIQKLAEMMDTPIKGLLGVSVCNDEEAWKYYIAVASTAENSGFDDYTVPASTWAVFPGSGTNQSIQELERRIVTEWLPTSGYEYANAPDIEVYLNPDPQNAQYEVWIPVRRAGEGTSLPCLNPERCHCLVQERTQAKQFLHLLHDSCRIFVGALRRPLHLFHELRYLTDKPRDLCDRRIDVSHAGTHLL